MGKLTVGIWTKWGMYFIQGPSEYCKKLWGKGLTKDQYEKYGTLNASNNNADQFEMMGEGDERLREILKGEDEC
jgi:hypothetical protein